MKYWFSILTISIVALCASVQAQEEKQPQWYEVEVILFEHLDPEVLTAERWPLNPGRPALDNVIELLNPDKINEHTDPLTLDSVPNIQAIESRSPDPVETTVDELIAIEPDIITDSPPETLIDTETHFIPEAKPEQQYIILPVEQYQMRNQYNKLSQSEQHLPLLHIAWRQIIPARSTPDQIHLHSNIETVNSLLIEDAIHSESFPVDEMTSFEFSTPLATSTLDVFSAPPEEPVLDGVLSLGLGRYIHVNADFAFKKPGLIDVAIPESTNFFDTAHFDNFVLETTEEEIPEIFRIQGKLRLPSGKVHYLDHPMVGMLILFTRYTPPVVEIIEEGNIEIDDESEPALAPL